MDALNSLFDPVLAPLQPVLQYKIFNAPAWMVVPAIVLSIIYVVLVIRFFKHMGSLGVNWSGKKYKMALLLGAKNSGKTQFFHAVRDGEFVETVSSMKELTADFVVHERFNANNFGARLEVVDYPGNERLRAGVADFYPVAGCIVFFVDASDASMFRKAAEYLYDIFSNAKVNDLTPPMLIACNKSDVPNSATPEIIREALEKELTKLKTTRSSLETEGDDGEQDQSTVPVGREGKPFEFAVDSPCEVKFAKCSVKNGAIAEVVDFIQKH